MPIVLTNKAWNQQSWPLICRTSPNFLTFSWFCRLPQIFSSILTSPQSLWFIVKLAKQDYLLFSQSVLNDLTFMPLFFFCSLLEYLSSLFLCVQTSKAGLNFPLQILSLILLLLEVIYPSSKHPQGFICTTTRMVWLPVKCHWGPRLISQAFRLASVTDTFSSLTCPGYTEVSGRVSVIWCKPGT